MKHVKDLARGTRVEIYADWLADDVDGLIHNIKSPFGDRHPAATVILAEARTKLQLALERIDQAIAADFHAAEQENA